MSLLVPTNPNLIGLSKNQLMRKRVCKRHFDQTQFDSEGARIRFSYPCLFTELEIVHGVPLNTEEYKVENEHNYFTVQEHNVNSLGETVLLTGTQGDVTSQEHLYSLPSTSQTTEIQNKRHESTNLTFETVTKNWQLKNSTRINTRKPSTKQFNFKTRRYIKKCTNIAYDSLGDTNTERLQNAQRHTENMLMENFEKLNKKSKAFLLMQLKLVRKNKMARRFSLEDKLFALALMKQSPKGYKLLETMFALPNKRTLARLSEKIVFECGINNNIFAHIKKNIRNWDMKKRLCSLVFDEVALTPHLIYNENKDKINGFVEIAGERKPKFADHALVFMIRRICSSWRQSIAYYFCAGTISAAELEKIIPQLNETGLIPLALVCDQGSTFRSCFKSLRQATARLRSTQAENNDHTIHIAGHDLFLFHDSPHLLKGIRNNFLDKDIIFEDKRASWKDILHIYDLDSQSGHTRALPRLTAENVDPKKIKVKAAAQVLSARTAAMLKYTHAVCKYCYMHRLMIGLHCATTRCRLAY